MTHVRGLVCRECGRGIPQSPVHVCEHCFGPLDSIYFPRNRKAKIGQAVPLSSLQ